MGTGDWGIGTARQRRSVLPCVCATVLCMPVPGEARAQQQSLRLPRFFADHMVLQRDTQVRVWGRPPPGAIVSGTPAARPARATADALGVWAASLPAMRAGGP